MRSDEFHQRAAEGVRDVHDQPIFVAAEVEDHAVVADEINRGPELPFHIVGIAPAAFARHGEPGANRPFGLRVALPEFLEGAPGDHLHVRRLACHQFGDNRHPFVSDAIRVARPAVSGRAQQSRAEADAQADTPV